MSDLMKHRLAPPEHPLHDGVLTLRMPDTADLDAIITYAKTLNRLKDHWLPSLGPGASSERCANLLADWHSAWIGRDSYNGPTLVVAFPDAPGFVGIVSFAVKRNDLVEMTYGIAPSWRNRGFATRAARLASVWLMHDRGFRAVELLIPRGHPASQRVAVKAGFQEVGAVSSFVKATGMICEDLRYIATFDGEASKMVPGPVDVAGRQQLP